MDKIWKQNFGREKYWRETFSFEQFGEKLWKKKIAKQNVVGDRE